MALATPPRPLKRPHGLDHASTALATPLQPWPRPLNLGHAPRLPHDLGHAPIPLATLHVLRVRNMVRVSIHGLGHAPKALPMLPRFWRHLHGLASCPHGLSPTALACPHRLRVRVRVSVSSLCLGYSPRPWPRPHGLGLAPTTLETPPTHWPYPNALSTHGLYHAALATPPKPWQGFGLVPKSLATPPLLGHAPTALT